MRFLPTAAVPQARFAAFCLVSALAGGVAGQAEPKKPLVRDVAGTVTGANGAKVRVTLRHNDMGRGTLDPVGECFAAADGSFELRGMPWFEKQQWGSHKLVLVAQTDKRVALRELRGDALATDALKLELADTFDLQGTLREDGSGKPIANAWVWPMIFGKMERDRMPAVWVTTTLPPFHATTDAEGRFTLKGLPPLDGFVLVAGGDGYARTQIKVDDQKARVEGALPLGGRITGTVLMPDGKPAVRVRVRAGARGIGYGDTMTGDDGTFCLSSLAPDVYKVWAEVDDLTVIAVVDLAVEAGGVVEKQTVQLVKGGFIVGRIVDKATGKPITPGPHTDVAMYGPARGSGGACEVTPVLADGTFRIRAPAGRNHIYLRAAVGWSEPSEYVEVVEGQETNVEWQVVSTRREGVKK